MIEKVKKYYRKFIKLSLDKRVSIILLTLLFGYLIIEGVKDWFDIRKLKNDKAYVIALIYDIKGNKSGPTFQIKYVLKGKVYKASLKKWYSYRKERGDHIFIQVLKKKPTVFKLIDYEIPNCPIKPQILDSIFISLPNVPNELCQ